MKTLKEQLNEGIKPNLIEYKTNYNVRSDVYNILEALAFRYELKGKKFDQKEVEEALEWFTIQFFDDLD